MESAASQIARQVGGLKVLIVDDEASATLTERSLRMLPARRSRRIAGLTFTNPQGAHALMRARSGGAHR
jgi:hypothetical protein